MEGIQPGVGHLRRQLEPWVLSVVTLAKGREDVSIGGTREALGQPGRKYWQFRELGRDAKRDWRDAKLCQSLLRNSGNCSGSADQDSLQHLGIDSTEKDRVSQDGFQKFSINCFSISFSSLGCRTCVSLEERLGLCLC